MAICMRRNLSTAGTPPPTRRRLRCAAVARENPRPMSIAVPPHPLPASSRSASSSRRRRPGGDPGRGLGRARAGHPLLAHAFLSALHGTGCAAPAHRLAPRYLTAWRGDALAGAMPLYAKTHPTASTSSTGPGPTPIAATAGATIPSWWRAIPFTPVPGPRLLARDDATRAARCSRTRCCALRRRRDGLLVAARAVPDRRRERALCARAGMLLRHGVQFHWDNPGYRDFADFLAAFNHDKRKKVKQERRQLARSRRDLRAQGGREITAADWAFFYACYERTYAPTTRRPTSRSSSSSASATTMPEHLLLVHRRARRQPVCAALDVFDARDALGPLLGDAEYVPGLHFEACYYQAIEFCIERGIAPLRRRRPGRAQARPRPDAGDHVARRTPSPTPSSPPRSPTFCARERIDVAHAVDELERREPVPAREPCGDRVRTTRLIALRACDSPTPPRRSACHERHRPARTATAPSRR